MIGAEARKGHGRQPASVAASTIVTGNSGALEQAQAAVILLQTDLFNGVNLPRLARRAEEQAASGAASGPGSDDDD